MEPCTGPAVEPTASSMELAAERELRSHFAATDPRLAHSLAVGACAAALAPAVKKSQRGLLRAAALLHDIGYADEVADLGFHPVDGALYLRRHGWPEEVCTLVAHHSGARFVARARGPRQLVEMLDGPPGFAFEENRLTDALTAADQTVGPDGDLVPVEERMRDMLARHGPDSPQARAHPQRAPYLRAAVARVEARLEARLTERPEATAAPLIGRWLWGRAERMPRPRQPLV